jgi:hypothetical protein
MNSIKLEWQHLKKDELSGQRFEDELDMAYAVIDGVQARGKETIVQNVLNLTRSQQVNFLLHTYLCSRRLTYTLRQRNLHNKLRSPARC